MNFFKKSEDAAATKDKDTKDVAANTAFPDMGDDKGLEEHAQAGDPGSSGVATVEDLSKRFDEYKEASEAREARLLEALANASAPAVAVATTETATEAPEPFKPADLPDAVEDAAGYARVLQENIQGSVKHMLDAQTAETSRNSAGNTTGDAMWDRFEEQYEDLAKHEELVEIHAKRVANTLAAQGIDVQTYMVQHRDKFLGDVAKSVGARLVTLGLGPKEEGGDRPDPITEPNRTGGLPGTNAASAPTKDGTTPAPGGFIAEIHKTQKDMGLI